MNIINPQEFDKNFIDMIANDWFLLCAEKDGKANAMTCSWGGTGYIFRKNAVFVVVRDTRYTKEFIDNSNTFSINFFPKEYRDKLSYFGKTSGRDEDKITEANFTLNHIDNTPIFDEACVTITCKKALATRLDESAFLDEDILKLFYADKNMHTLYIGEIINMYQK